MGERSGVWVFKKKKKSKKEEKQVPPRFELGLSDSESEVLTVTPRNPRC